MPLTNQEKIDIINQHINNSEKNEYNLYLSLLSEQSKNNNEIMIDSLQEQIDNESNKRSVLNIEKNNLSVSNG
jgi:hypothetical protein